MSYSRWSRSFWYCFWSSSSESYKKDDQLFDICAVKVFTYKELKTDINSCLKKVKRKTKCSKAEIEELRGYMKEFIKDVRTDPELTEIAKVKRSTLKDLPLLMPRLTSERAKTILNDRLIKE
jgi:hypothetical protein